MSAAFDNMHMVFPLYSISGCNMSTSISMGSQVMAGLARIRAEEFAIFPPGIVRHRLALFSLFLLGVCAEVVGGTRRTIKLPGTTIRGW